LVAVNVTNIFTDSLGRKVNYTGHWANGVAEGFGKGHFFEQTVPIVYTGNWKNGLANGQVEAVEDNGNTYSGMYKDGMMSGFGTYTWARGDKYEGNL
jgi:hypothetical protein